MAGLTLFSILGIFIYRIVDTTSIDDTIALTLIFLIIRVIVAWQL